MLGQETRAIVMPEASILSYPFEKLSGGYWEGSSSESSGHGFQEWFHAMLLSVSHLYFGGRLHGKGFYHLLSI